MAHGVDAFPSRNLEMSTALRLTECGFRATAHLRASRVLKSGFVNRNRPFERAVSDVDRPGKCLRGPDLEGAREPRGAHATPRDACFQLKTATNINYIDCNGWFCHYYTVLCYIKIACMFKLRSVRGHRTQVGLQSLQGFEKVLPEGIIPVIASPAHPMMNCTTVELHFKGMYTQEIT